MKEVYSPAEYCSETPPPRIIGTEMEYWVGQRSLLSKEKLETALDYLDMYYVTDFLLNGAKLYPDVGKFLEYATQECLGPWQAAAADHAGMKKVRKIVDHHNQAVEKALPAIRSNGSFDPKMGTYETNGYHENYMTIDFSKTKDDDLARSVLSSFIATRTVWNGNGLVGNKFLMSQKATGIGSPILPHWGNRTQHGNKPMGALMVATQDNGNNPKVNWGWMLLEVRHADCHMSRRATFTALGATSLVLRMLEQKYITRDNASRFLLRDPVEATKIINPLGAANTPLELLFDGVTTASSIQRQFAEAAQEMIDSNKIEIPGDEKLAADLWLSNCDRLVQADMGDGDLKPISTAVEWATKLYLFRESLGDDFLKSDLCKAIGMDRKWHNLSDKSGETIYEKIDHMQTEFNEDIDLLESLPPDTRALARATIIEKGNCESAEWNKVSIKGKGDIRLPDPYSSIAPDAA